MPDSLLNLAHGVSEPRTAGLQVKIFADGADLPSILELAKNPLIAGFTTNPTLMRKAGVRDYEAFGRELTRAIPDRPFSFEVLSDDFEEMEQQALEIASWGENVYVKIPITNTRRMSSAPLIDRLSRQGVKVNVTAIMTLDQVDAVIPGLRHGPPARCRRCWCRSPWRCCASRSCRNRSASHAVQRAAAYAEPSPNRADLGQSARAAEHRSG